MLTDVPYDRDQGAIVMLAGPIKHWWGENWDTPEHWDYVEWRDTLNEELVNSGYLVYRPHEAFKGNWTEKAQSVNDLVLRISDVILDMTPPGIPSLGTDGEKKYAQTNGNALILAASPTGDHRQGAQAVAKRLDDLEIKKAIVDQEIVIDSFGISPRRKWLFSAAVNEFMGQVMRLHYLEQTGLEVVDASHIIIPDLKDTIAVTTTSSVQRSLTLAGVQKLEVLARTI